MTKIKILITGGTFDKYYDEIHGNLSFSKTHLPNVLEEGRSKLDVDVQILMLKDSLEMSDADRDVIAKACQTAKETKIVLTHGTDTMPETARYLAARVKDKTVVLTGAMVPYAFGSSDGLFNLGAALAYVQTLPKGVYVAMNGQVFDANNVKKDKQAGVFTKLH